jgi:hypothetical protein
MGRDDVYEFAGADYLGLLPEFWEMKLVAGDPVVGAGSFGAFNQLVDAGIFGDIERARWDHALRTVLYELAKLLAKTPADLEFGRREDCAVFRKNRFGDIEAGRFGHRQYEYGALQAVGPQSSRDDDICVNDQSERDHLQACFCWDGSP